MQLVGYSIWQRANLHRAKSAIVSERDVTEGIALAEARFHDVVHEPAISGLGLNDIKYLLAMCEDKQQSKSSEIAKRMGKKTNEVSSIRAKFATKRGYSGTTEGLRVVCRAGPRYLSARERRGDSRTVLGRVRATSCSLRLLSASIAISGFSGAAVPVIIEMWHSSSPANQISSIYNIACFNLQEQRYHSQSVRVILPVHNCFRC